MRSRNQEISASFTAAKWRRGRLGRLRRRQRDTARLRQGDFATGMVSVTE